MVFTIFNCKFPGHGRFNFKRCFRLVSVLCLGVMVYTLVMGSFKFTTIKAIRERIPLIMNEGLLTIRVLTAGSNDTMKKASSRSSNLDTQIQGIAFNQTDKDILADHIKRREARRPSNWNLSETEYTSDTQFVNYMKCPTSVRKKLLEESFLGRHYLPEVPLLMWNKHYSQEEYSRLAQFQGIYGWQVANASVISSGLSVLNTTSNTYLFDNDRAPGQDGCTSCAVIGNGGILNGSKMGKEIDSHDYVFRVNVALTKGHEEDVGSKTSFYCAAFRSLSNSLRSGSPYGFREPPYQDGIRYVFFPKTGWAYMFLADVLRGKAAPRNPEDGRGALNFPKKLKAEDVKLVHPDFERYIKYRWVNSTHRKNVSFFRPSTGAIMLLLALHTCDKVDVYGFAGSFTKYSEYYYDTKFRKHVSYLNHDSATERNLWLRLHQLGVINLYTRE